MAVNETRALRVVLLLLASTGCADDGGTNTDGGALETGSVANDSSGDNEGADSGTGTSMPDEVDQGVCAELVACVDAANDQPLTPLVELYGPTGTCWGEFEAEACWQDCETTLAPLRESSCPDTPECCECVTDDDCADTPGMVCSANVCAQAGCELVQACAPSSSTDSWLHFCNNDVCTAEAHALLACLGAELGTDAVCGIVETTACTADGECDDYATACEAQSRGLAACIYG